MRILYDHQVFSLQDAGGISRYYFELLRGLAALPQIRPELFIGFNRNQYPFAQIAGVKVLGRRGAIAGKAGAYRFLLNEILSNTTVPFSGGYDVYHPTLYHQLAFARFNKMVVTHHDCAYERYPSLFSKAELIRKMRVRQFARADAILCPSESTRRDLHHFYNVPEEKTHVIYHGISDIADPAEDTPAVADRPYLLYVGSRAPYKNFGGLLKAFANASLKTTWDLLVVGGGAVSLDEASMITELSLSEHVRILPRASDEVLVRAYRDAHLLVYPSLYEGFGFPPLEAMSLSCPVLAAASSCIPEVCGEAAFLFDPSSEEAFVETLKTACFDETLRRQKVELGKAQARKYSWEKCAKNTMRVYSM